MKENSVETHVVIMSHSSKFNFFDSETSEDGNNTDNEDMPATKKRLVFEEDTFSITTITTTSQSPAVAVSASTTTSPALSLVLATPQSGISSKTTPSTVDDSNSRGMFSFSFKNYVRYVRHNF